MLCFTLLDVLGRKRVTGNCIYSISSNFLFLIAIGVGISLCLDRTPSWQLNLAHQKDGPSVYTRHITDASHRHVAVAVAVAVALDGLFSVPGISAHNGTNDEKRRKKRKEKKKRKRETSNCIVCTYAYKTTAQPSIHSNNQQKNTLTAFLLAARIDDRV